MNDGGPLRTMGMCTCNGTFSFACSLFLLSLFAAAAESLSSETMEKCSYSVTIQTTCTKGAETSSNISLRFGDTSSNDILVKHLNSKHVRWVDPLYPQILDDIPRKPFQACMINQFQVTGRCVNSPICYLYLKLAGSDDWRPGFAQVILNQKPQFSSNYFYFRRYLPRHVWHGVDICDGEVTPFGIKHKRKIFVNKVNKVHFN